MVMAIFAQNEIVETNFSDDPDYHQNYPNRGGVSIVSSGDQGHGNGWFDTARQALAGPAGQMVVHVAKEMISRSAGNSQVRWQNYSMAHISSHCQAVWW